MTLICAWCDKVLDREGEEGLTHGICPTCFDIELEKILNEPQTRTCEEPEVGLSDVQRLED